MFQVKSILNTKFGSTTSLTTDTSGRTCPKGCLWDNARWHDPSLGRFAQADTIVPGGVQGLDRYAYVNNNPLRYTDPTGHMCTDPEDPTPSCDGSGTPPPSTNNGGGSGSSGGSGGGGSGGGDEEESNPGLCAIYGEGCGGGGKPLFSPREQDHPHCPPNILSCTPMFSETFTSSELYNYHTEMVNNQSMLSRASAFVVTIGSLFLLAGAVPEPGEPLLVAVGTGLVIAGGILSNEATEVGILANEISNAANSATASPNDSIGVYIFRDSQFTVPRFTYDNSPHIYNASNSLISTLILSSGLK